MTKAFFKSLKTPEQQNLFLRKIFSIFIQTSHLVNFIKVCFKKNYYNDYKRILLLTASRNLELIIVGFVHIIVATYIFLMLS